MQLPSLFAATELLRRPPPIVDLRSNAYLATYPALLAAASNPGDSPWAWFCQIAAMTYGWMPRVVRLDMEHSRTAAQSLLAAHHATQESMQKIQITPISLSVRSVVGASKMLHFANPNVYPIWDSRIETTRLGKAPGLTHMQAPENYWRYCAEVHEVRMHRDFRGFYVEMEAALAARLEYLGIEPYPISEVRAVELAVFELSARSNEG